ncbi:MAG: hypothetical protein J6Q82_01130 [Clostridia bacterium]|nr:hypothetical protein [Clostridia bacterium]
MKEFLSFELDVAIKMFTVFLAVLFLYQKVALAAEAHRRLLSPSRQPLGKRQHQGNTSKARRFHVPLELFEHSLPKEPKNHEYILS